MPRTRTGEDRDDKVAEIVDAAARMLRARGVAGFSVAAVARELDVAQNTVYWYFGSRDELFVAAMRQIMDDVLARKRQLEMPLGEEVVWFVERLREIAPLRAAMLAKTRTSEPVAQFAHESRARLRRMLLNALSPRVDGDAELVADVVVALVNGVLETIDDADRRREVVTLALDRLTEGRIRAT